MSELLTSEPCSPAAPSAVTGTPGPRVRGPRRSAPGSLNGPRGARGRGRSSACDLRGLCILSGPPDPSGTEVPRGALRERVADAPSSARNPRTPKSRDPRGPVSGSVQKLSPPAHFSAPRWVPRVLRGLPSVPYARGGGPWHGRGGGRPGAQPRWRAAGHRHPPTSGAPGDECG